MNYTVWTCVIVLTAVAATLILNWCVYRLCRSAVVAALMGTLLPGLSIVGYSLYLEGWAPYGPATLILGLVIGLPALVLGSMTIVLAVLTASTRSPTDR